MFLFLKQAWLFLDFIGKPSGLARNLKCTNFYLPCAVGNMMFSAGLLEVSPTHVVSGHFISRFGCFPTVCFVFSGFFFSFKSQQSGSPRLCLVTPNKSAAFFWSFSNSMSFKHANTFGEHLYMNGSNLMQFLSLKSQRLFDSCLILIILQCLLYFVWRFYVLAAQR